MVQTRKKNKVLRKRRYNNIIMLLFLSKFLLYFQKNNFLRPRNLLLYFCTDLNSDSYLCQLELLLLIDLNELDFGFLQQVEHRLIRSTETNSMAAGPADLQRLSTVLRHASCFIWTKQKGIKQPWLDDSQLKCLIVVGPTIENPPMNSFFF